MLVAPSQASAGTFKHITIDGSFADWAGVPVAATDDEGDATAGFDLREIYAANDENYLYLLVRIYPSSTVTDYSKVHHQFFIDGDNDPNTGRRDLGLGAEMAVEDGWGFSQRYGSWNDGDVVGLDSAVAPTGPLPLLQYEIRLSRAVRDINPADVPAGSGNPARDLPVFASDTIAIACGVSDKDWAREEGVNAFTYEMAPKPPPFSGTKMLATLSTTNWQVNDSGTDPGPDWLTMGYDDAQAGWKGGPGLFGFNAPAGVYPAPVATTLASGRSAYYFRTRFNWDTDSTGAGLLASNYLSAGAVFYLNGAEVKRVRMPVGTITYSTPATGGPAQPGTAELLDFPPATLVNGENILEVEVHPAAGAASSLVFALSLVASDNFAPRISDPSQPADRAVEEGQATTFSAGAIAGTEPFTYQWLKGGAPIAGATTSTLTLDPVVDSDAGGYSVEISNPKGSKVTSRTAVLTTTAVPIALVDSNQPANQMVAEGKSATFSVAVTGTLPVYQWYKGAEPITNATGPQLTLDNLALSDSGSQYYVVISNRLNKVTSRSATLTVVSDSTPPTITRVGGGGRGVTLAFSEPVDPVTAQMAANYTLDGGVQVQGAVLDPADATVVTLTTAAQQFGRVYKVSATGVRDVYGNPSASSGYYQSSILIDGNLDDWTNIPVLLEQEQTNPGSPEFKSISVTNDANYIYIRMTFYTPVGPLAASNWSTLGNYFQVVFDTDADPATGGWLGGEVLDEVNSLYRLVAGGWTLGSFVDGDTALAPMEVTGTDFELRVSLKAKHGTDGLPAFPNAKMGIICALRNTGWTEVDNTSPTIEYTLGTLPPMPATITVRRVGNKIELTWPGGGTLQTRASLSSGTWADVPGAASGVQIDTATATASYYRIKQ